MRIFAVVVVVTLMVIPQYRGARAEQEKPKEYTEVVRHVKDCLVAVIDDGSKNAILKGKIAGTGFFVAPNTIVTADHIVDRLEKYQVRIQDTGQLVECRLLVKDIIYETDPANPEENIKAALDVALLEVIDESFSSPYLQVGQPEKLQVGDDISVYGYPNQGIFWGVEGEDALETISWEPILSRGIVSALQSLEYKGKMFWKNLMIHYNANIGAGSSGAPLFLSRTGEVIGIASFHKPIYDMTIFGYQAHIPGPIGAALSSEAIGKAGAMRNEE